MEPPAELRNIIGKLAQFVARNGTVFEEMTKQKQRNNPKFEFLFGGPFHPYYLRQVKAQLAIIKIQNQVKAPLIRSPPSSSSSQSHGPPEPWAEGPSWAAPGPSGNVLAPPPGPPPALVPPPMPPLAGPPMPPGAEWCPPAGPCVPSGTVESLKKQIQDCQTQIQQSEANLAAQHGCLMQQQQRALDDAIREAVCQKNASWAHEAGLDLEDFDRKLTAVMEQCTKEAIAHGKSWILSRASNAMRARCVCEHLLRRCMDAGIPFDHKLHIVYLVNDLLHHCQRKSIDLMSPALKDIAVPLFCTALNEAPPEKMCKLEKLRNLWAANQYFDEVVIAQLNDPVTSMANYQAKILSENSDVIQKVTADIQAKYATYQKQHMEFVAHLTQQITRLQLDLQAEELRSQQEPAVATPPAAAPAAPPQWRGSGVAEANGLRTYGERREGEQMMYSGSTDYAERREPSEYPPSYEYNYIQPEVMPESFVPDLPYYKLPAGLMVPLVKLSDCTYEPIDAKDLRLPPKLPPSEHLLAALDAFYAPPTHERPRNSEGWEQLGLYEYFKAKNSAKSEKYKGASVPVDGYTSAGDSEDEQQRVEEVERTERNRRIAEREARRVSRRRFRETPPPDAEPPSMSPSPPPSRRDANDGSSPPSRRRNISPPRRRSLSPEARPSFGMQSSMAAPTRLDESNKGHQLLKKMGWGGAGLGASEQGIAEPIKGGEIRDRSDMYRGVGMSTTSEDMYETYRKNRGQQFISRMRGDGR